MRDRCPVVDWCERTGDHICHTRLIYAADGGGSATLEATLTADADLSPVCVVTRNTVDPATVNLDLDTARALAAVSMRCHPTALPWLTVADLIDEGGDSR